MLGLGYFFPLGVTFQWGVINFYSRRHDVHKYEHDQMHIWLCSFQTLGLVLVKDVAALP